MRQGWMRENARVRECDDCDCGEKLVSNVSCAERKNEAHAERSDRSCVK